MPMNEFHLRERHLQDKRLERMGIDPETYTPPKPEGKKITRSQLIEQINKIQREKQKKEKQ